MLVGVWESMEAAIPRVLAEEWLAQYTVAVVSSPYVDKDSREGILSSWRKLFMGTLERVQPRGAADPEMHPTPLRQVIATMRAAFGRAIRD